MTQQPVFRDIPVLEHVQVAPGIFRLTAAIPAGGSPGQFYLLRCWERDPLLSRPVSIHDIGGGTVSFLYQVRGRGTALLSHLQRDDPVTVTGPLGNGFTTADLHGNIALVSGGIGIAPMLFLARSLPGTRLTVLAGFRHDVYAVEELQALGAEVHISTEDGCTGIRGFCTDLLDPAAYDAVLVCGPTPMMQRVAALCAAAGTPCQVSLEQHMACGVGACLVCTCRTLHGPKRVCADGPVFDAREVIWDA